MAHLHNTSGFAEEAREPKDYFAYFPSLHDLGEESKPKEMDTAQTVDYLKRGFGLIVPTAYRQKVGLPD
jgi:hypothetical protein